ncbi:Uncharacterized protein dnm_039980 [Desulfonema magnum]|uniref:Uncharacterized protein n=1 Tax=Desulfonema magnum TaxID=45655 RepID=A0A975GNN5_9BACT|nr:Uncharacterized protein dnm_039980 [Desulfonema magnum]
MILLIKKMNIHLNVSFIKMCQESVKKHIRTKKGQVRMDKSEPGVPESALTARHEYFRIFPDI